VTGAGWAAGAAGAALGVTGAGFTGAACGGSACELAPQPMTVRVLQRSSTEEAASLCVF
jgi:hypothetical protein